MYCAQQINIPSELPDILKQFTKAAIRTQPPDILAWSAAYFQALAVGDTLPVKRRLEAGGTGLTAGLLDVLLQQLKGKETVDTKVLEKKWREIGLHQPQLNEILQAGGFTTSVDLMKFVAVGASHLGGGNIVDSMRTICQVLTEDSDGGPNRIPIETFKSMYEFLTSLSGEVAQSQIELLFSYLQDEADRQNGMIMPRNFLHPDCPKLT